MKIIIILSLAAVVLSYNYNDPLGLDAPSSSDSGINQEDDIISGDEIASFPHENTFLQKKEQELEHKYAEFAEMRPGYLDVNMVTKRSKGRNMHRFKQDDDFYNPNIGSNDVQQPTKEMEILRKEGLSNGIVTFDNKRTVNFETGSYPEFFNALRKD
jgi:hypothetical protein